MSKTYLDVRAKFALARVLLTIDYRRSLELAEQCLVEMAELAFETPGQEIPWPAHGELAMEVAFLEGAKLGERHRDLQARCEARRVEAAGKAALEHTERLACLELAAPAAAELLAKLQAGANVKVNGHSLSWDADFEGLTGVNAYGMDYFWSHDLTPESIGTWRTALVAGRVLGRCPPGGDIDDGGEEGPAPDSHWSHFIVDADGMDLWTEDFDGHTIFALDPWFAANLAYKVFHEENLPLFEEALRAEEAERERAYAPQTELI